VAGIGSKGVQRRGRYIKRGEWGEKKKEGEE
jgi:hypothetical protein